MFSGFCLLLYTCSCILQIDLKYKLLKVSLTEGSVQNSPGWVKSSVSVGCGLVPVKLLSAPVSYWGDPFTAAILSPHSIPATFPLTTTPHAASLHRQHHFSFFAPIQAEKSKNNCSLAVKLESFPRSSGLDVQMYALHFYI